jgi:hypothetical protein
MSQIANSWVADFSQANGGHDNAHDASLYTSRREGKSGVRRGRNRRNYGIANGQAQTRSRLFRAIGGKARWNDFFDLAEPSQIIEVVEPLFSKLHAAVEIVPVMSADDLRKGIAKVRGR